MPVVVTSTEYLVIGGITLATPAWRITDLTDLWDDSEQRGSDIPIPDDATNPVLAQLRRRDVTRKALPIDIYGDADQNGVAYSDPVMGVLTNVEYLKTNLLAPTGATDGTRAAVWHRKDGTTKSANVHVFGPLNLVRFAPDMARGVLRMSIPTGAFA